MRLAENRDIEQLAEIRILQQKDDWKDEFEDRFNLYQRTKEFLQTHLNRDLYIFVEEDFEKIIATCGLQIIEYLPQCNDNGKQGYICNVFTRKEYRKMGIQTKLLRDTLAFAKEKKLCELSLSADDEIAVGLYKKAGFQFDELKMVLKL